MPLAKIELTGRMSLADELYDELRSRILSGRLLPGERLVETALAEAASTSRTPVREALHRLEVDGLVQPSARGVVVCSFSSDELADLCAVRETLEGMAAGLAAQGRGEIQLLSMRHMLDGYQQALDLGDVAGMVDRTRAFHEEIWSASGNRYLAQQLFALRDKIEQIQETILGAPELAKKAMEEHELLYRMILERDAAGAEETCRAHYRDTMAVRLAKSRLSGSAS